MSFMPSKLASSIKWLSLALALSALILALWPYSGWAGFFKILICGVLGIAVTYCLIRTSKVGSAR
jgi:hypothetical protein